MKLAILLVSLTLTCLQPTPLFALPDVVEHGGRIESKYDGFSHETIITLKKMKVTCDGTKGNFKDGCVSVKASLHCPGIQLDYVRYARIEVIFQFKEWDQRHPVDQRELSVVVDGETIRLGGMTLASQKTDVMMTETLEAIIPYKTFKRMANAQVAEMQVGKSRFELREKNLLAFRDMNNRVMAKR